MDGLKALSVLQLSTSLPIDNVIDIYLKVIHALPVSGKSTNTSVLVCC